VTLTFPAEDNAHNVFNGTGEYKMALVLPGQKMNSTYFMECVLGPLMEGCYPEGRKPPERKVMLHFDNASIHNTEEVQEHLTNLGFKRKEHAPYSPDLAPCNCCLFRAIKENCSGQRFESVDGLCFAIEALLRGPSADFLRKVFLELERRLRVCCESRGEYVEQTGQDYLFLFPITCADDESPGQDRTPCISRPTGAFDD
jgi:histone-lysine N-methyltransferase SETMAR